MNITKNFTPEEVNNISIIMKYKQFAHEMVIFSYPDLSYDEIEDALNYSIIKRMKNKPIELYNSYKDKRMNSSVLDLLEYIMKCEPIITPSGVMFKKHCEEINPVNKMIQKFLESRKKFKKEMFKYPKGTEQYEKYNLLQLLEKVSANSIYGCLGNYASIYYNVHVASSVTACGRSSISAAGLCFEMFLANNVKFRKLDEVVTFINHVMNEKSSRKYNDRDILDKDIDLYTCFIQVVSTCGHGYVPDMEDCEIVWDIMSKLNQEDLNRLYYKNNLLEFMDNKYCTNALIYLLQTLESPFMDPNEPPKEIRYELDLFWDLVKEYVFYGYQIIDRQDRLEHLPRKVTAVIDTDSFSLYKAI